VGVPEEARALTHRDPRMQEMEKRLRAGGPPGPQLLQEHADLYARVHTEKLREVAERFDSIHSVERALQVGSLDAIVEPERMRTSILLAIEAGMADAVVEGGRRSDKEVGAA